MTDSEGSLDVRQLTLRQYAYFTVVSLIKTPEEMTQVLGLEPDETSVRGSRRRDPDVPRMNRWSISCTEKGLAADTLVRRIVERLLPIEPALAGLSRELRANPREAGYGPDVHGGCELGVVRHFNDPMAIRKSTANCLALISFGCPDSTSYSAGISTPTSWVSSFGWVPSLTLTSTAENAAVAH